MNNLLPAAVVGLATGALAAGVVLFVGLPSGGPGTPGIATSTSSGAVEPEGLADQVARLSRSVSELRDTFELRQSTLEAQLDDVRSRVTRTAVATSVVATEIADAGDRPAALDVSGDLLAVDPEFEFAVAAAIQRIEERERAERDAEREQRALDQLEERIAGLRDSLGLDTYQETQVRTVLLDNYHKSDELRERMRTGELERDEIRSSFEGLRTELDEAFAGILSPSQFQKFQEEGLGGFRGFGGGGGPGGFGGRRGGGGGD